VSTPTSPEPTAAVREALTRAGEKSTTGKITPDLAWQIAQPLVAEVRRLRAEAERHQRIADVGGVHEPDRPFLDRSEA
jgi:hypothetical protein